MSGRSVAQSNGRGLALDVLTGMVEDMAEKHRAFVRKLSEHTHPDEVLSWAESDVRNAAFFTVYRHLVRLARKSPANAAAVARREAIERGKWPPSSTSTMSNLVQSYTTAAYATFAHEWAEALETA